ncbi:L,D-transpeptidase family protein [Blautia sp.]|uniref:L,D-transpeptidase family protein n=1 Tax=Blautia sp. TaxID=1955243 RepID=UPI003992C119
MKKRRMKLLALMLTAAVTFTSVLPVGATATNGSEAPQQVTELTDPLDEGGGVTDNGQGNTDVSGDVQNGIDQTGDEQPGDLPAEPNHDAETAQDDHWTLEQAENKMRLRYMVMWAGYQKKWELDKQSGIWTYFEVQEDGTEAAATPKPYDEFDVNGTHVGLYETVGYLDEDLGAVTLVYAFASTEEGLKGYGGYWYQNENGCFTYYTTEADAEGDPDAKMAEGLQVPGSFLEGLNTIKDEDGEYTFWLDAEGRPLTNAWKIVVGEDENKTFCYFGEDGKMLTEGMPTGLQTIEGSNYWIGEDGKPETAVWKKLDGKYYYFDVNGVQTQDKTGLQKIDGSNYWVNKDGSYAKSKWIISGGKYYYFGANGKQTSKTGLQTINGKKYYVNKNGTVRKNTSVIVKGVRYFFGKDGKCTKSYKVYPEGWKQNATGWWYQKEDGSWPANCWYKVNGQKYYFDANGYMRTGWLALGNKWYYLTDSGAMAQGWVMINKTWYYLTPGSGVMKTGWYKVGNTWYYSNGSGAMQTGWLLLGNTWYYLTGSGAMAQGWTLVNGTWYYLNGSGAMQTGWLNLKGTWYYLNGSGAMQTGWLMTGGTWYYLNGNGAMAQGWLCLGGTWYYLTPGNGGMKTGWYMAGKEWYYSYGNGAMARNAWIDTYYYVGSSGAMLKDTTIGGYYVDKNGRWIPGYGTVNVNTIGNWEKTGSTYYFKKSNGTYAKNEYVAWNGNWYYLDGNGAMLTGWHYIRGYKMYFTASGALQQDVSGMVGGPYRLRVNRTKCQITVLAKDGSNGWTIPVKSITCSVGNPITLTPAGTFYIGDQDRWHILMGPSWGQWTSHVVNGIFIHSVAGSSQSQYNLAAGDYNMLGQPASHGCIRVCVRDAKWIYDNTGRGTMVTIGDGYYEPFDKPATIKLPYGVNLKDPTDIW